MEPIIAEDVGRSYASGHGVHEISLTVQAGQCLGVLGPNGSGKTTLTRLIAGLDRVQTGRLSVLDAPACPRSASLRSRCGVSLDTPAHWEELSGRQNLWFFARQYGLAGPILKQRVVELLADADLAAQADEPVSTWSFGMKRKLSILEALCHDPDLLILDEPSAGCDAAFLERLTKWIHKRCDRGKTTWISDNNADWISRATTRAVLLSEGRIEAEGSVVELIASVGARNKIEIQLEHEGFTAVPDISGVENFNCQANTITAEVDGNPSLPAQLLNWITSQGGQVRSMEIRSVTLQDALAQRAKQKEAAK